MVEVSMVSEMGPVLLRVDLVPMRRSSVLRFEWSALTNLQVAAKSAEHISSYSGVSGLALYLSYRHYKTVTGCPARMTLGATHFHWIVISRNEHNTA